MTLINCAGKLLSLHKPIVMGILNITPDSFYTQDGRNSLEEIVAKCGKMIAEGASIIDIGGQSTRPGSQRLTAEEEYARIEPALKAILHTFPEAIISIDTYHAEVARKAVHAGAHIINDISAGNMDADMINTVAALKVPYIAMHMKGTPENMQDNPTYENVVLELFDFFINKVIQCNEAGIKDLILDPGFGFGKTIDQNIEILHALNIFKITGKPLLAGLSRKATIYKTLGTDASGALNGTTVLNTIALQQGAKILRVHDVKEAMDCIKLLEKIHNVTNHSLPIA